MARSIRGSQRWWHPVPVGAALGLVVLATLAGCSGGGTPDTVSCTAPAPPAEALLRAGAQSGDRLLPGGRDADARGDRDRGGGFPVEAGRPTPRSRWPTSATPATPGAACR